MLSRIEAEKRAKRMVMSGYRHHIYEDEIRLKATFFYLERDEFADLFNKYYTNETLTAYADILAPNRMRALKNSLICFIQTVCRMAIDAGAEAELCFALSDSYIYYLESVIVENTIIELFRQITFHFYDIAQNQHERHFSKPIAMATRYIGRNIYNKIRVSDIASYVRLERHYFSSLFLKETKNTPGRYILNKKLSEAKNLLAFTNINVTEAAEALGFCDPAHFSKKFKEKYGCPPSQIHNQIVKTARNYRILC